MSLNIIRKNSSSPFNQQRSMVNQSGSGGAYESGGYDPGSVYDDSGVLSAIIGFGSSVGAGLSSLTAEDKNNMNVSKSTRLKAKKEKVAGKNANDPRIARIDKKLNSVNSKINAYNEYIKPTLKSDINGNE